MGCEESTTIDERPIPIEKKMTGLLEKDLHFQDCLIQSENDLEN